MRKAKKKTQIFLHTNNKSTTKTKTVHNNKFKKHHKSHRSNPHSNKNTKTLTLEGTILVHEDLKEYGHPYSRLISKANISRVYSQNIRNMPVEVYIIKSHCITKEFKKKTADVYLC